MCVCVCVCVCVCERERERVTSKCLLSSRLQLPPITAFKSSAYISDELSATIHRILAPTMPEGLPLRLFLSAYKVCSYF